MPSSRFTGQEFDILWSAYGRDRLPYPLRFRTDIDEFDALRRDRERAVANLLDKYDPGIERALGTLLNPDARLESKGFAGTGDPRIIRFHGAIRGEDGAALTQEPGTAEDTGGEVVLTWGAADEVAAAAVAALPECGPGTRAPLEIPRARIAEEDEHFEYRKGAMTAAEQVDHLFRRPRSGYGEIAANSPRTTGDFRTIHVQANIVGESNCRTMDTPHSRRSAPYFPSTSIAPHFRWLS